MRLAVGARIYISVLRVLYFSQVSFVPVVYGLYAC